MGDKIDHQSEFQHPKAKLECPNQQCQQNGISDVFLAAGCGQRLQRC